jgi:hypothetical protein
MSEEALDSLSLAEVKQRFVDSERALNEIAARLTKLREAEASTIDAAATLSEASTALRRFVETSESVVVELAKVQEEARTAVSSASSLLQGDDIRVLERSVTELRTMLDSRLSALESRVDSGEQSSARTVELEAQLAKIRAGMPTRWRTKLGM